MSTIDIELFINNRLLLSHPNAKMIRKLHNYVSLYFGVYNFFKCLVGNNHYSRKNRYGISKQIKHFNQRVCKKCFILYVDNDVKNCKNCLKTICYNCDQNFYALKCIDCIGMCIVCESYVDYLYKCYFCNRYICFSHNRCGYLYLSNNFYYNICSTKCIPIDFLKNELIFSLKVLNRKNKLTETLNMYNIEIRLDSKLCNAYIYFKLDKTWTTEKVAQKMCEMKYLFEVCDIVSILRKLNFKSKYKFQIAKQIALNGSSFPIVWNWDTEVKTTHNKLLEQVHKELSITPSKGYFTGGKDYIEFVNKYKNIFKKL